MLFIYFVYIISLFALLLYHAVLTNLHRGQNGRLSPDDIFRCIFVCEKLVFWSNFTGVCSKRQVNNNPALVQIMAYRQEDFLQYADPT